MFSRGEILLCRTVLAALMSCLGTGALFFLTAKFHADVRLFCSDETRLQIQDDGTGIARDDFEIVCERFTTSKLQSFEDLNNMTTYGFRGEALASISHVAHVTITSRTAEMPCAYKARYSDSLLTPIKAGDDPKPKPCAGNKGTQIAVEDLFYNVPTRRKALSSTADEFARIYEVVSRYAIHNAGVAFSLKKHGETTAAVRTTASATKVDNIRTVFGSTVANELLQIGCEDIQQLKFKMDGLVSNANYSVKRATFILFINNRLVNSTAIKKALDQVYAAYLPKGTHSFMYLSLQIHPANIDVNVHPTKMQVHFLNEDAIIEMIQQSLSEKLLGANASRTFFTQTLLPGAAEPGSETAVGASSAGTLKKDGGSASRGGGGGNGKAKSRTRNSTAGDGGSRVYDHDLVRTDSRSQTLHAFLDVAAAGKADAGGESSGAGSRASLPQAAVQQQQVAPAEDEDEDDWDPIRQRPRKKKKTAKLPEPVQLPAALGTDESSSAAGRYGRLVGGLAGVGEVTKAGTAVGDRSRSARSTITWPCSNTRLNSIQTIREELDRNEHKGLRDVFRDHIFVGCIDLTRALLQHKTKMYVTQTKVLCKELFYQLAIRGFSEFNTITLSPPAPLYQLALAGLSRPGSSWTEEDGPKEVLAKEVVELLVSRAPMLDEYFSIRINDDGELCTLPILLDECAPSLDALPTFIVRFATEVTWDTEKECFESIAREIGEFYKTIETNDNNSEVGNVAGNDDGESSMDVGGGGTRGSWKWIVEHRIYPAFRGMFQPPKNLSTDAAIVQIADLHQLYKIFERC